jgi:hypothetical protein
MAELALKAEVDDLIDLAIADLARVNGELGQLVAEGLADLDALDVLARTARLGLGAALGCSLGDLGVRFEIPCRRAAVLPSIIERE